MKILIADDHWVVRESLKQVMKKVSKTFEPFEAATFEEAIDILRDNADIELMLVDLIMPGFEEFAGLKRLRSEFPEVPIVVVSVHEDVEYVIQSINHGVIGYIPKTAGAEEIIRALTLVLSGEVAFPRHILERSQPARDRSERPRAPTAATAAAIDSLTNREREVLGLLGKGMSAARIAGELDLSPHTVRVHVGNLMRKLGLKDRAETIHYAVNLARPSARRG
jgi:DNA-binding NarL/FixJ family response regulator